MTTALSRRESNPYYANERKRSRQDPDHQRNKQDGRQRRERADKCAGPEKDDDAGEEGDLADVERRKPR